LNPKDEAAKEIRKRLQGYQELEARALEAGRKASPIALKAKLVSAASKSGLEWLKLDGLTLTLTLIGF